MDNNNKNKTGSVMVVGGGISGIQTVTDLSESGFYVYLVEKLPSIGGVMAQLDKTFPTNDCSMCILSPKLVGVARNRNIELLTNSEVVSVGGESGNFKIKILKHARSVDIDKCTSCGICTKECPIRYRIQTYEKQEKPPEIRDQAIVDEIIKKNLHHSMPIIQILLDVNQKYKYLPKDVLKYLSFKTSIPLSKIYRIATFYKAFTLTPKGKYHFKICVGTACHVRGATQIAETIEQDIKGCPEGLFSVEKVNCLGVCASGPVVVVNDEYYGNMDTKKTSKLINELKNKEAGS